MGRPVGTNQTCTVNRKTHGQPLQSHVMHHLIITALQEGRIDRAERPQPAGRHTGGKGHAMLFGNADIKDPRGKALRHDVQARPIRHRRRHRHNLGIARRYVREGLTEYRGIAGRVRL